MCAPDRSCEPERCGWVMPGSAPVDTFVPVPHPEEGGNRMHSRSIRRRGIIAVVAALVVAVAVSSTALSTPAQGGAKHHRGAKVVKESGLRDKVPQFTRDASYPAALPNNWAFGGAEWAQADTRDHVWFFHRPLQVPAADLLAGKIAAPAVVELDEDGDFVRGWGGTAWLHPWFVGSFGRPASTRSTRLPSTASTWTPTATSGSPVTAASCSSSTATAELLLTIGHVRPDRGKQQHDAPREPDRHVRGHQGQRGLRGRRVPQPTRRGLRLGDRRVQAALGRLRQRAE